MIHVGTLRCICVNIYFPKTECFCCLLEILYKVSQTYDSGNQKPKKVRSNINRNDQQQWISYNTPLCLKHFGALQNLNFTLSTTSKEVKI